MSSRYRSEMKTRGPTAALIPRLPGNSFRTPAILNEMLPIAMLSPTSVSRYSIAASSTIASREF